MLPQKITQISEQALPPVHVPLILGNEFFILSQQDVRKLEECRLFSINKLMPNGDLKTINIPDPNYWLLQILKQENLTCNQNVWQLLEFLNGKRNQCQPPVTTLSQQRQCTPDFPQPMEISNVVCENPTVASIEQQLQWNKCVNTSAPFPLTYSLGTSTTEINCQQLVGKHLNNIQTSSCCCCCTKCQRCFQFKELCNKCTSTQGLQNEASKKSCEIMGAREQLKKKKLNFCFDYIT
ncbi:uncharacterized protein Mst89B [Calliphora vicina]|uniref:uncharacterized protein Mst89B n=1 Tax=Calliphora vicina TaxID=7373 RepID=UPI00325AFDD9